MQAVVDREVKKYLKLIADGEIPGVEAAVLDIRDEEAEEEEENGRLSASQKAINKAIIKKLREPKHNPVRASIASEGLNATAKRLYNPGNVGNIGYDFPHIRKDIGEYLGKGRRSRRRKSRSKKTKRRQTRK